MRWPAVAAAVITLLPFLSPATLAQDLQADRLLEHVRFLADDALGGRETGEPGADSAAAYIESQFRQYGLRPLFGDTYRQTFSIATTISVGTESSLVIETADGARTLELGRDWYPYSFSSAGSVEGHAHDAGYGLEAGDYEGAAEGAVLLIDAGVPQGMNPHSGLDPSLRRRATVARDAGAGALIAVVSQLDTPQVGDLPRPVGIPVIQVVGSDDILRLLRGSDARVRLEADVVSVDAPAFNIGGVIHGRDGGQTRIVVGAHYDHLGMGGPGSLAPDTLATHNGADDNASGTALLLGLAEQFAMRAEPGQSDVVFVAFTAEEMGLLGSDYFAENPPFDIETVEAMVNFDMVGRLSDGKLQVFGTDTATELDSLLDQVAANRPLKLSKIGDGYGPSDQTSFYARGVPVLHLFSGTHSEYHRPEDDWQLINADGMVQIGSFAAEIITRLAYGVERLTFVRQERQQMSGRGGYGPYLGTVPDFGEVEGGGLGLSGVRPGSPAEQAGLQGGDVIIRFGEKDVLNIYDYTYALRDHAPGDTVRVTVRRGQETLEMTAILGQRN